MPNGSDTEKPEEFDGANIIQISYILGEILNRTKSTLENLINWSFAISTATLVWAASNVEKLSYSPCTQCDLAWYRYLFFFAVIFLASSTIALGILRTRIYYCQYKLDNRYELALFDLACSPGNHFSIKKLLCSDYREYIVTRDRNYISYRKCFLFCSFLYSLGIFCIGLNIFFMLKI